MYRTYVQLLLDRLEDPYLTNADVANLLGTSERSLYRLVQARAGVSPNHFLRRLRLERAEQLLGNGSYRTVKEVALRVGFIKVSYFTQLYVKAYGVRPSELLREERITC